MKWIKLTLVISVMLSVLLSYQLWASERSFPYTPLFTLKQIPPPYDVVYVFVLLSLGTASILLRKQRLFLLLLSFLSVWLALNDITRVQPWFYIYNALLVIYIFYDGRVDDPNKYTSYFIILQVIVASIYFFTGFSQINPRFVQVEFAEVISPLRGMMSERQFQLFMKMGAGTPYVLMAVGLGLMVSFIRYLAVTVAIVMHFFLLIFLFPSEKHPNYALWFSNLVFIILLMLLFSGKTKQRYFSPTFLFQLPLFYLTLALFVIAPLFNRSGSWPDFLSCNINSANNKTVRITFSRKVYDQLPVTEKQFIMREGNQFVLNYEEWCRRELNAECFPDKRVFNSIFAHFRDLEGVDVKEIELQFMSAEGLLRKP